MIHFFTGRPEKYDEAELNKNGIKFGKLKDFFYFMNNDDQPIQLDTETNVVRDLYGWKRRRKGKDSWSEPLLDENGNKIPVERHCHVVQIGDAEGVNQYIFDIPELTTSQIEAMLAMLKSNRDKILHNALFDYIVIKWNFGIDINNLRCTYITSRQLHMGRTMEPGFHSFAGCCERYLNLKISKSEQESFNGDPLTVEQIYYSAIDVVPLYKLKLAMQKDVDYWGLENAVRLNCAFVRPLGDGHVENFFLDQEMWMKNVEEKKEEVEELKEEVKNLIIKHFKEEATELNFIQKEDRATFPWGSSKIKNQLLRLVYKDLPADCTTLVKYGKYKKELDEEEKDTHVLDLVLKKEFRALEEYFIENFRDELIELGIMVPKGNFNMNLGSPAQTTPLFKLIDPTVEDSTKETINKLSHPIVPVYQKYVKANKLYTSYGTNFIDAISPDGMLRIPDANILLVTGRVSLSLYQLLPGNNKYRNPFYTWDDFKVVGMDYSSQEALIAATICKEQKMLDIFINEEDFHSKCAALLFPETWKELGGDPAPKGKPENPELLAFRDLSKKTSFGQTKNQLLVF